MSRITDIAQEMKTWWSNEGSDIQVQSALDEIIRIDQERVEQTEPNSSEKPNNCETCRNKGFEGCEQPCLGCGCCGLYEPKDEPNYSEIPNNCEPQTERSE